MVVSRKVVVESGVVEMNNNNNEIMGEKVMERSEVIEMVKNFVENMENDERKEFLRELSKEIRVSFGDEGRKGEVRKLLEESGEEGISIVEMGERLGVSNKNISSILSYLKKDGLKLMTKSNGKKVIER